MLGPKKSIIRKQWETHSHGAITNIYIYIYFTNPTGKLLKIILSTLYRTILFN